MPFTVFTELVKDTQPGHVVWKLPVIGTAALSLTTPGETPKAVIRTNEALRGAISVEDGAPIPVAMIKSFVGTTFDLNQNNMSKLLSEILFLANESHIPRALIPSGEFCEINVGRERLFRARWRNMKPDFLAALETRMHDEYKSVRQNAINGHLDVDQHLKMRSVWQRKFGMDDEEFKNRVLKSLPDEGKLRPSTTLGPYISTHNGGSGWPDPPTDDFDKVGTGTWHIGSLSTADSLGRSAGNDFVQLIHKTAFSDADHEAQYLARFGNVYDDGAVIRANASSAEGFAVQRDMGAGGGCRGIRIDSDTTAVEIIADFGSDQSEVEFKVEGSGSTITVTHIDESLSNNATDSNYASNLRAGAFSGNTISTQAGNIDKWQAIGETAAAGDPDEQLLLL